LFGNNILNKGSDCIPCLKTFIKAASLKRSVYLGLPLCFFRKAALMGKYFQARRRVATSWWKPYSSCLLSQYFN